MSAKKDADGARADLHDDVLMNGELFPCLTGLETEDSVHELGACLLHS